MKTEDARKKIVELQGRVESLETYFMDKGFFAEGSEKVICHSIQEHLVTAWRAMVAAERITERLLDLKQDI